ncbi:MAG: hypothetical protein JXA78_11250 [Anaerolineales bacterium]|nr:hypothetical protein [Anaerolineales bacterium]
MDQIDWFGLIANGLWILGCALALAALSYASWQASQRQEKLSVRLGAPGSQRALFAAGVLFCAGLALLSATTVEMILWVVLSVVFGAGLVGSIAGWKRAE